MEKIPSLFKRDYNGNRQVYNVVTEGCEWVLDGQGVATEKFDGTSCAIIDGYYYKRYTLKKGKRPPASFIPTGNIDNITGKQTGWIMVIDLPENKYHIEAFENHRQTHKDTIIRNGTYELVGPKVQGNLYALDQHELWLHGSVVCIGITLTFDGIKEFLQVNNIEGIVWHHPNGKMAKIKAKDFGIEWPRGN